MILMIDNYDSFTYNLYQAIGVLYPHIEVKRNDEITLDEIETLSPEAIIISPGPCYPSQAGISEDIIKHFSGKLPILGVCLGHQAIAEAFGGRIIHAKEQLHGKQTSISINTDNPLFAGLTPSIKAARYHSLIVDSASLPECLSVIATDDTAQIMAIRHREHPTYGVQFHPESILTNTGMKIIDNFLTNVCAIKTTKANIQSIPDGERRELIKYIRKVVDEGKHLTEQESFEAVDIIMNDRATNAQIAALLTAMRLRGENVDEVTGFVKGMRKNMTEVSTDKPVLEIVGTGGDLSFSFNISTTSAFVVAGAGQAVAKHGNRGVSSKSGAADVLEALGVNLSSTPEKANQLINETNYAFLFAQKYHSAMRFVGLTRRQIGIRTIFNILGPLANPAKAEYMLLGAYSDELLETMAHVLMNIGVKSAMLVHGQDGFDEISISAPTTVCEVNDNKIIKYEITPEQFGFKRAAKSDVLGGEAKDNAAITKGVLNGTITGAKRDIVLLNAGCGLYVAKKAASIEEGIELARQSIDSGAATSSLESLIALSNEE